MTFITSGRRERAASACTRLLRLVLPLTLACANLSAQAPRNNHPADPEAQRIMDRVDRMLRGDSSRGSVEMSVVTPEWKRMTRMTIWSEGVDKVLILVELPKKDEGTAFAQLL